MYTQIIYAPLRKIGVTAFSSVTHLNLTSVGAYEEIGQARSGSFGLRMNNITLGRDDGGAGKLANEIFQAYWKKDTSSQVLP